MKKKKGLSFVTQKVTYTSVYIFQIAKFSVFFNDVLYFSAIFPQNMISQQTTKQRMKKKCI